MVMMTVKVIICVHHHHFCTGQHLHANVYRIFFLPGFYLEGVQGSEKNDHRFPFLGIVDLFEHFLRASGIHAPKLIFLPPVSQEYAVIIYKGLHFGQVARL